jgi:predicted enzyme related to lactoylglutathione lyase
MNIKYAHTNIVAKDWKCLAKFYTEVFNCQPLYPERNLSGEWIEKVTSLKQVNIKGIHLRLPGFDENGPTLEIFQYEPEDHREDPQQINGQGFGHIAFHVEDVEAVLAKLVEYGGKQRGELVKRHYSGLGLLAVVYAEDPEGNIVEIQNWKTEE